MLQLHHFMIMVITDIRPSWNGGSTTWLKTVAFQIWFASGAPSANNTAGAAGNLNRSSNNTFDLTVQYWDEVGDGMTIAGGSAGFNMLLGQGSLMLPIEGAIILGANDTISFHLVPEEIGEASIQMLGFMEDK